MSLTFKYRVIAALASLTGSPSESVPVSKARENMRATGPTFIVGRRPSLASVRDETLAGVKVRRYVPHGVRPGVLLYFHGGGWVVGDVDSHDVPASGLAAATSREVVSVDYRLAPEHRYPAALEDCVAVAKSLAGQRIVVAGDSAGGGLAASVSNACGEGIAAQVLLYPVTDCADEAPSYEAFATGYFLSRETMRFYRREYVPDDARRREPGCSPLRAESVRGVARAYVLLAGCDVLRDEGRAYAKKLEGDGVETVLDEVPGVLHGFFSMQGLSEGQGAMQRIARWLEPGW